jgi:hypothetical protein
MGTKRKTTKLKLLAISRWLGSIPSLAYALVYLFLIPSFAFVYYELPGHFYHSTLQYEGSSTTEYEELTRDLSVLMYKQREKAKPGPDTHIYPSVIEGRPHYWAAYVDHIENLSIEDESISFILRGNYYAAGVPGKENDKEEYEKKDIRSFSIPARLSYRPGRVKEENGEKYENELLTLELPDDIQRLFPDRESQAIFTAALFPQVVFQKPELGLRVPEGLLTRIRSYASVRQIGSTSSGNFVRMLYLSAVTITTLGFGDVVPMTTASRVLVSCEAILGIVLIGLFLNALSFERAHLEGLAKAEQIPRLKTQQDKD